jgi:hypothetical protein
MTNLLILLSPFKKHLEVIQYLPYASFQFITACCRLHIFFRNAFKYLRIDEAPVMHIYSDHVFNTRQMYDVKLFVLHIYTSPCKVSRDTHYTH